MLNNQRMIKATSLFLVTLFLSLYALTPVIFASSVSESYVASESVPTGSIISIDSGTKQVSRANTRTDNKLIGVSVSEQTALLALNPEQRTVQVAISGSADVLATSIDGAINIGDLVAVSALDGIGVKAKPGDYVVGRATSTMHDQENLEITGEGGEKKSIEVGRVTVTVAIGYAPNSGGEISASSTPLQKVFYNVTGREISTGRIIASLVVALVAMIMIITLVHASIYSGVASIGRNPLAKYAINKALVIVLGMILSIIAISGLIIAIILH
jgi:hypothetical protein